MPYLNKMKPVHIPRPSFFKILCNNTEDRTLLQHRRDTSNLGEIEFLQDGSYHNRLPCSESSQKNQQE
jgi:hypothetical protein